jgi:hypothetical protein
LATLNACDPILECVPNHKELNFIFFTQLVPFSYSLAQIGRFWRFRGHLEGDLIPKRGQIFVGSWASSNEPKKYINQDFFILRGCFVCRECKEELEFSPISHVLRGILSCFERSLLRHVCICTRRSCKTYQKLVFNRKAPF